MATTPTSDPRPLLEMRSISKSFPGVRALHEVDLHLYGGEILALLGENGAGKSTLIKMLGGAHQPDAGTIRIAGEPQFLKNPAAAREAGIGVIFQEFNLVPELTVCENMFLGRETSLGLVSRREETEKANAVLQRLGVTISPGTRCRELSISEQQIVEIARALLRDVRILVMDEPSATLTPKEVRHLYHVIRELQSQGIGIIYISHRLDEIFELCDRVIVLRDGENAGEAFVEDTSRQQLIEMMVGREITNEFPKQQHPIGPSRLSVKGLRRGTAVHETTLEIRRGEILGLTGLVGAGRTELARLLFGADRPDGGELQLDGKLLTIRSPADAIQAGICLLTEDRKMQGLILDASARENFGLPNLNALSRWGIVRRTAERHAFSDYIHRLKIRISNQEQTAGQLSGGNQQKVVLAKWLHRNAEIIILDEPTRGIDVGAKYEIYQLMNDLAARGKAVLMISSELPEVLGMSDRILVMHEGRITGEVTDVRSATQEQLIALAVT